MGATIILECGSCHMGDLNQAEHFISEAAGIGADYAKFQLCAHKGGNIPIKREWLPRLKKTCEDCGVKLLVSIWSVEDSDALIHAGLKSVKLAFSATRDLTLLKSIYHCFDNIFCTVDPLSRIDLDKVINLWTPSHAGQAYYPVMHKIDWEYVEGFRFDGLSWHGSTKSLWDGILGREGESPRFNYYEWHMNINKDADCPDSKFALDISESRKIIKCLKSY